MFKRKTPKQKLEGEIEYLQMISDAFTEKIKQTQISLVESFREQSRILGDIARLKEELEKLSKEE